MKLTDIMTSRDLTEIHKEIQKYTDMSYEERKKYGDHPAKTNFDLLNFLPHAVIELGKVKAIKVGDKYSATKTWNSIEDTNIKGLIKIIYSATRSTLMEGTQGKNAVYGGLTPIFLYAQKLKNGIMYEAWDKSDPLLKLFLSKQQEVILKPPMSKNTKLDIVDLRNTNLAGKKASGWQGKMIHFKDAEGSDCKLINSDPRLKILLQTWLANVEVRVPDAMILDLWDWDNTPEAFDIECEEIVRPSRQIEDYNDSLNDLPWD